MDEKMIARFWSKVNKDGPVPPHLPELGPCWVWSAALDRQGYGSCWMGGGNSALAHRVAWFLHHGRWPEPCCLHKCDNPSCVRIGHLFEGTVADNNLDMIAKGRHTALRGSRRVPQAKLTESDVASIRALLAQGLTQQAVADRFAVKPPAISKIACGRNWKQVP